MGILSSVHEHFNCIALKEFKGGSSHDINLVFMSLPKYAKITMYKNNNCWVF